MNEFHSGVTLLQLCFPALLTSVISQRTCTPIHENLVAVFNINSGSLVAPFLNLSDAREMRSACRSTAFLNQNDKFYAAVRVSSFILSLVSPLPLTCMALCESD